MFFDNCTMPRASDSESTVGTRRGRVVGEIGS